MFQVYLSRSDANVSGTLSWKFDFSAAGLVVDFVTLKIDNAQGKGGQVSVKLIGDSGKKCVPYLEVKYKSIIFPECFPSSRFDSSI